MGGPFTDPSALVHVSRTIFITHADEFSNLSKTKIQFFLKDKRMRNTMDNVLDCWSNSNV